MKPNNPFLISGYHSPEFFCDRLQETDSIINALSNNRNVTLIAPRRIGKTGLIKNVFHKLNRENKEIIMFYMDIFPTQNLGDFIRLFANTVLGKLDSAPLAALNRVTKFLKSCRPVITIDPITGAPKISIDVDPAMETVTLKEIFEYLNSSSKRCYIAIDEFQQINSYPEREVEALLRSYIQFATNIGFIFSGSKQHLMNEMFLSAKRPFYQSTQIISIDCINKSQYYNFASAFFNKQGRDLKNDVFDYIYEKFEGYTWYIQVLLNRLFSYPEKIDISMADKSIKEVVAEFTYTYENLLNAYPANSIKLLKAIADSNCVKEINSGSFISRYNLKAASSINTSLKKLLDNELIYKTPKGYTVYDRFMAIWFKDQIASMG